jgi:Arc/MetJ-type ribon-helix-helix transcriptional regulator
MSHTITVRLPQELAAWLEETAAKTGVSQGELIRTQLEKAKSSAGSKAFMRLAGTVAGAKGLSRRKGFSRT